MSKKGLKLGVALAAGAGAAALLKKTSQEKHTTSDSAVKSGVSHSDYRNTELGKHEKNSKGIYYTNGNYEAFARPE